MVLKHHRRPFCHLNLCNKILLTEWLILEGRWLKCLARVEASLKSCYMGQASSNLQPFLTVPDWRPNSSTPTQILLLGQWGHLCCIALWLQILAHQCLAFLTILWWMNVSASQVTVRSLSCISHLLKLFPVNTHSLRSYDRPGHARMHRWLRHSPALKDPVV